MAADEPGMVEGEDMRQRDMLIDVLLLVGLVVAGYVLPHITITLSWT